MWMSGEGVLEGHYSDAPVSSDKCHKWIPPAQGGLGLSASPEDTAEKKRIWQEYTRPPWSPYLRLGFYLTQVNQIKWQKIIFCPVYFSS